jgi:translocation and assembly module TamB
VNGDRLGLTLFDQGVKLKDGIARITLDNNFVDLREVVFHGGTGTLKASGRIPLEPTGRELSATITADHLQLLTDPSRQLTISGQARIANVNQQLQVNGRFKVDRALFTLPDKAAPELSDDVVIVHPGAVPKKAVAKLPATGAPPVPVAPGTTGMASLLPPLVNINVDLGDSFRFKGAGADIFLGGALDIKSGPKQQPQAFGTVRVVSGVYEAFGAKLAIESGLFYFQGAISNPSINLLAMRRNQAVAAGVQVTGTVQQPRVELVSEPNLSEEEKLSWLVFGHGGSGGSAGPGAAQSAAFGLLNKFGGTSIASKVGLDKFSVGSSEFGKSGAQVVNLGKEISNKLFIGFEQGLSGASSAVKLTYELSQHWSLVVRGGAVTGVDVLYSRRFDKLRGESAPRAVP